MCTSKPAETHIVHFKKIETDQTPLEIFSRIYYQSENLYLLESIEGPQKLARFSFIGFSPIVTVEIKNNEAIICNEETGEKIREKTTDPLHTIKCLMAQRRTCVNSFRFTGGAVGYISYDAIRYWEKLPNMTNDEMGFPDVQFSIFDDGIVIDHRHKTVFYYYLHNNRFDTVKWMLRQPVKNIPLSCTQPKVNVTKSRFEQAVEKAKAYIKSGDIFQVVLSKRYTLDFKGDLIGFYQALREINPSPYMYFLKINHRHIVGSSPEMLVRVNGGQVETFPIAGTRPCTTSERENQQLAEELLADPKEQAEHVMLVDLARNDLGKISEFGTVRVPEFMKIQRYSHVQHIVSQVVGKLRKDRDCYDALRAVFPAGTVSGAPKVRAMEIIEELEHSRRGPYAGAVGYFSYNGNADFAITIRTLFTDENRAHVQAGAGIVADSVPEREWFETEHKTEALMKALHMVDGEII
ncbi:MAG: anthranilate synthase component I [Candidatus Bathyarchaeia archaeon]